MTDLITTITSSVVFSGFLTSGLIFLTRNWISERLKNSIKHEYDLKLEVYKKETEYLQKKNYLRFSKLHEERANVIKDLYSTLVTSFDSVSYLVFHLNLLDNCPEFLDHLRIPKDNDRVKWERYLKNSISESKEESLAKDTSNELRGEFSRFRTNRIYFERDISEEIEKCLQLLIFIASHFSDVSYRDPETSKPTVNKLVIETWKQAITDTNSLFPILEDKFRDELGIKEEKHNMTLHTNGESAAAPSP